MTLVVGGHRLPIAVQVVPRDPTALILLTR